jgi:hypothetical protein
MKTAFTNALCLILTAFTLFATEPFTLTIVPSESSPQGQSISMADDKAQEFYVVLTNSSKDPQPVFEYWNSAVDVGVCGNRLIPSVLHEWREPRHKEFSGRNIWSFFNAFTESLKVGDLMALPKRTQALHGLLDSWVGLN